MIFFFAHSISFPSIFLFHVHHSFGGNFVKQNFSLDLRKKITSQVSLDGKIKCIISHWKRTNDNISLAFSFRISFFVSSFFNFFFLLLFMFQSMFSVQIKLNQKLILFFPANSTSFST